VPAGTGQVKLRLDHFVRYAEEQRDDAPLYVFDADFGDEGKPTVPLLGDFAVPHYFGEDLYSFVGEKRRPPYRYPPCLPRLLLPAALALGPRDAATEHAWAVAPGPTTGRRGVGGFYSGRSGRGARCTSTRLQRARGTR
jgi:hypothetical protein